MDPREFHFTMTMNAHVADPVATTPGSVFVNPQRKKSQAATSRSCLFGDCNLSVVYASAARAETVGLAPTAN
jgi:hypothetical protein